MGPGPGRVGSWLRSNLGQALGWAEFALMASLSGDYLVHLGLDQAEDSAKSTRSLAATGAVIWMLRFCEPTELGRRLAACSTANARHRRACCSSSART